MSVYRRINRAKVSAVSAEANDRRSVCRYSVVYPQAWIGWWEKSEFRNVSAEIVDISLRGALLKVEGLPPPEQSIWFCPPHVIPNASNEWLEARVIEARKRLLGPRQLRIMFRRTFPYEIFKAVVYGPEAVGGALPQEWIPQSATEGQDLW